MNYELYKVLLEELVQEIEYIIQTNYFAEDTEQDLIQLVKSSRFEFIKKALEYKEDWMDI